MRVGGHVCAPSRALRCMRWCAAALQRPSSCAARLCTRPCSGRNNQNDVQMSRMGLQNAQAANSAQLPSPRMALHAHYATRQRMAACKLVAAGRHSYRGTAARLRTAPAACAWLRQRPTSQAERWRGRARTGEGSPGAGQSTPPRPQRRPSLVSSQMKRHISFSVAVSLMVHTCHSSRPHQTQACNGPPHVASATRGRAGLQAAFPRYWLMECQAWGCGMLHTAATACDSVLPEPLRAGRRHTRGDCGSSVPRGGSASVSVSVSAGRRRAPAPARRRAHT